MQLSGKFHLNINNNCEALRSKFTKLKQQHLSVALKHLSLFISSCCVDQTDRHTSGGDDDSSWHAIISVSLPNVYFRFISRIENVFHEIEIFAFACCCC